MKRKIYVIARGVPSKGNPLNGVFELDQAKALMQYGHNVVFVALDFRSIRRLRRFGVFTTTVDSLTCFNISFPLGNIEYPLFNFIARKLTWIGAGLLSNKLGKPDILHAHFAHISSLAVEIKQRLNVPLVVTEHSSLINTDTVSRNLHVLAKEAYNKADSVICVSQTLSNKLKSNFNIYPIVIHNIVDVSLFEHDARETLIGPSKQFVFVSVGTLNFNKGFDILIQAFALAGFTNDVKLKIIGDGELKDVLFREVTKKGLNGVIEFTGFKTREEIVKEFENADAFVLASRSETFGLAYIEALLAGLPVIATKCGGPEEFVNETNGVFVPINDAASLSDAMVQMVEGDQRYNRPQISLQAKNEFSPDIIAEKLTGLYEHVLTKNT